MWVDRATQVANKIKEKILGSKNSCSDYFGVNASNALDSLTELLTQKPDYKNGQTTNTGISQTYGNPTPFKTDSNGQKLYRIPDIAVILSNGPFTGLGKIGLGGYGPGSGGTQIVALLHEIAHNIVIPLPNGLHKYLITNDGGDTDKSVKNTDEILMHCKEQIFEAAKSL